jgi:SAM-dependent methyltransferase
MNESPMEPCKLCDYVRFEVLFNRDFKVLLCCNCGLIFISDGDRDYRKYYTDEYNYRMGKDGRFVENKKVDKAIFRWVIRHLPKTESLNLLEIGCNAGFLLKRFQDHGISVFGIEPGRKASASAKRLIGANRIKCCMLEDIGETEQIYDVILLVQTFEHFIEPLDSLLKIRSLLKKEGLLFIEVPNYYAPNGFYRFRAGGLNYPSPNHVFVYTPKTLSAFLRKAGFSVYKTSYTLGNVRMIARIDDNTEAVEFDNYFKIVTYFRLLPTLRKAFEHLSLCKSKLSKFCEKAGLRPWGEYD